MRLPYCNTIELHSTIFLDHFKIFQNPQQRVESSQKVRIVHNTAGIQSGH